MVNAILSGSGHCHTGRSLAAAEHALRMLSLPLQAHGGAIPRRLQRGPAHLGSHLANRACHSLLKLL